APLAHHLLARLEPGDVRLHRRTGGLGALRRRETGNEGHCRGHATDRAGATSDHQPVAARRVDDGISPVGPRVNGARAREQPLILTEPSSPALTTHAALTDCT